MYHIHNVIDTDKHYIINSITRAVSNSAETKNILFQYDHNSERFTFELPRIIDGHDMTKCNLVQIHYVNVDAKTKAAHEDVYNVSDVEISESDPEIITFSWLVSRNATQYVGNLSFIIRFACVSEDGTLDYVWNTAINSNINIASGINNTEDIEYGSYDILSELAARILSLENTETNVSVIEETIKRHESRITNLENQGDHSDYVVRDELIGAIEASKLTVVSAYNDQEFTDAQKETARTNIGAVSQAELNEAIANAGGGGGGVTAEYVDIKVAEIVDSAPETLNTLKELSTALGNDENFATTVATQIGNCVKNTDIATPDKLGIVKPSHGFGVMANGKGELYVHKASNEMIDTKTDAYHPIVPSNLEYAVKSVGDNYYATTNQMDNFHTQKETNISFGSELINSNVILGNGWSGDFETGFKHQLGVSGSNGGTLTFNLGELSSKYYKVEVTVTSTDTTKDGCSGFTLSLGGSTPFEMYEGNFTEHTYVRGILSSSGSELVITPLSTFAGTITVISVCEIKGDTVGSLPIVDENGEVILEFKADNNNVIIGSNNANKNITGYKNVAIGHSALSRNTTGFWNVANGHETLYENTVGSRNVALGYIALKSNISGHRNIAIGSFAMEGNTHGHNNISLGADSMQHNTVGTHNIALGTGAMCSGDNGSFNIALGNGALIYNQADYNIGFGRDVMGYNRTGTNNIAMGRAALRNPQTPNNNIVLGNESMNSNTCTASDDNIIIGVKSVQNAKANVHRNIVIGNNSGNGVSTGENNILIGHGITVDDNTSNTVRIGNDMTKTVMLGKNIVDVEALNDFTNSSGTIVGSLVRIDPTSLTRSISVTTAAPNTTVTKYGKNLIERPYFNVNGKTINGITFTVNEDGSVTANGTATANADFYLMRQFTVPKGAILSDGLTGQSSTTYETMALSSNANVVSTKDNTNLFTTDSTVDTLMIRIRSGYKAENLTFYPQIEAGPYITDYAQYVAPETLVSDENGILYIDDSSEVITLFAADGSDITVNYSKTLTTKEYVDEQVALLTARIEELMKTISG